MAAATSLAGRLCIASGGAIDKQLSTQYIVGCDNTTLGCSGGWVQPVWNYLHRTGTSTAACASFVGTQSSCPAFCDNGAPIHLYRSQEPSDLHGNTSEDTVRIIQEEILTNGPVEAAYYVFSDFVCLSSSSSFFTHTLWLNGCCLLANRCIQTESQFTRERPRARSKVDML